MNLISICSCVDYTNRYQIYFSNPKSGIMWAIIDLHDYLMFFLLNILIIVIIFIIACLVLQQKDIKDDNILKYYVNFKLDEFNHAPGLEFFGTLTPTFLLFVMGGPSFKVLYAMEQLIDPLHTVFVVGNQGYGTYQYSDFDLVSDLVFQLDVAKKIIDLKKNVFIDIKFEEMNIVDLSEVKKEFNKKNFIQYLAKKLRTYEEAKIMYDAVIISDENLPKNYPRMLSTDQVLVLPTFTSIRLLVTSTDVIHSGALPSHGIKMDAIPGRMNQIPFLSTFWGNYGGQCSELCGINHGFMPIEVKIIPLADYIEYIKLNISYRFDKFVPLIENFAKYFIYFTKNKLIENKFCDNIDLLCSHLLKDLRLDEACKLVKK